MTTLSVTDGALLDPVTGELVEATIHVVDGRIEEVSPDAPRDADRVIDARGKTVLPGLIDAHFHAYAIELDSLELESRPLSYVALAAAPRLAAALRRGFTTVRDPAGGDAGIARAIRERLIPSPRYLWSGAGLSQTGGPGDVREPDRDIFCCWSHVLEVVDGVDALRLAVRERLRRGAHAIKVMASGGVIATSDTVRLPLYSAEELQAVCEEATRGGSYVAAHAYSPEAIRHAVDNGVRSIEHANFLDAETAEAMVDAEAFMVPTLVTYDAMSRRSAEAGIPDQMLAKNGEVLAAGRAAVELARAAGVPIGFGTDLMGSLEDEQLHGIRVQAEVDGVLETLRSATLVNSELLRRPDLGRIAPGCIADLLILDENPLERPAVLWTGERTVVQGGAALPAWVPPAPGQPADG